MSDHADFQFRYRGHRIQVSHDNVPDGWLGDFDTVFTVLIDDNKTTVPGIWAAYEADGKKGIKLVIKAVMQLSPVRIRG